MLRESGAEAAGLRAAHHRRVNGDEQVVGVALIEIIDAFLAHGLRVVVVFDAFHFMLFLGAGIYHDAYNLAAHAVLLQAHKGIHADIEMGLAVFDLADDGGRWQVKLGELYDVSVGKGFAAGLGSGAQRYAE